MPYYCTVPRCTSMAGKVKDVSFHQFPKDKELAKLWNEILKRGKPYTKYSKVCSLHFKPEDYTITGLGRNKGQWRTLRKDAVPSQNLPTESSLQTQRTRNRELNLPSGVMDSQLEQIAQVIYMQTMLTLNSSKGDINMGSICNEQGSSRESSSSMSSNSSGQFNETMLQIEHLFHRNKINNELAEDLITKNNQNERQNTPYSSSKSGMQEFNSKHTYKCIECLKCFKDPDVFILHKRTHIPKNTNADMDVLRKTLMENLNSEKENCDHSTPKKVLDSTEDTLRANPILANLLKSTIPQRLHKDEMQQEIDSVVSIEKQIMAAMAINMKNYFKNLSSMMTQVITKYQTAILSNKNINEELDNLVCGPENGYSTGCAQNKFDEDMNDTNDLQQDMQLDEENNSRNIEFD